MSNKVLRIGTRESQLAVWQANTVKELLAENGFYSELVYIKSEGDIDLQTPLYEIGVQGIFTRSLDIALLSNRIDLAVHSMKDVPTQLPKGIIQSAVLKRASYKDLLVFKGERIGIEEALESRKREEGEKSKVKSENSEPNKKLIIATSSIRRKAQWLHRFPDTKMENLRGNVNTRLKKVEESNWSGAIFAAAGLERINLRPTNSIELDWMLPAPAQGAIVVVCRDGDDYTFEACAALNDADTALCTKIEKGFLRTLMGGCSTPISALTEIEDGKVIFRGNILTVDGKEIAAVDKTAEVADAYDLGETAAKELLANGGQSIANSFHHER